MVDPLSRLLQAHGWLMADGATATGLYDMGLRPGVPPEPWNAEHPDRVRALAAAAVAAGSDILLTNTFGGNAARLRLGGAEGRVAELNRLGAVLAREAAEAAGRPVVVAGAVGPTGRIPAPMGEMGHAEAVEIFHQQAEALKAGGVDLLWIETMSSAEEFRAAAEAALRAGMPWVGTMSFDTAGRTMMGVTPAELVALVPGLDHPPLAFGANCGAGPADLLRTILELAARAPELPLVAKGNAGLPRRVGGRFHYDATPALMADYACLARDAGARIIGGCCGTTAAHLRAMRTALETRPAGPRPTLDLVARRLDRFFPTGDDDDPAPGHC